MARSHHRWHRIGTIRWICRACGLVRDSVNVAGGRTYEQFQHPTLPLFHPLQPVRPKRPPCTGVWPDGWEPVLRQQFEGAPEHER